MMRAPAPYYLSLLCAALGCGCSSPRQATPDAGVPDVCQPSGISTVIAEPEAYPGSTVTVHAAGRFITCDGGPDVPVDVSAQAISPSAQPVPLKLKVSSSPYQDEDGGLAGFFGFFDPDAGATLVLVDATFETPELGLYQVRFQFEPNLGSIQQDVLSMVDRRGERSKTLTLPFVCQDFDLQQGVELCLESNQVHAVRDGVVVSSVPAQGFIADGSDLWTLRLESEPSVLLTDYLLQPDGTLIPVATGHAGLVFGGQVPAMAWSQGQVMLITYPTVTLASVDGGAMEIRDAGTLPDGATAPFSLAFVPGQGAMVGCTLEFGTEPQLCLLDFVHDTMDCRPEQPIAADRDVVWTSNNSGALVAWQIDAGPTFTPTTTSMAISFSFALFQESAFPFEAGTNQGGLTNWGPAAESQFGLIVRRPLPPPDSSVAGYGAWTVPTFLSVARGCLWSNDFSNSPTVRYIDR